VDESVEKGSGGDDDRLGANGAAVTQLDSSGTAESGWVRRFLPSAILNNQFGDLGLLDEQMAWLSSTSRIFTRYCCLSHWARGDHTAGPREVLSKRNWMPTASVDFAHDATEGVHFAHQMAFGDAAHGGIAGHLGNQVGVQGKEGGLQAHAGPWPWRLHSRRDRRRPPPRRNVP